MKVKRFSHFDDDLDLTEIEDGDYVLSSDYDALLQNMDEIKLVLNRATLENYSRRELAFHAREVLNKIGMNNIECPVITSREKK